MNFVKLVELPHMNTYKRRWARRIMIPLTVPQELIRAVYGVFWGAAYWWRQP